MALQTKPLEIFNEKLRHNHLEGLWKTFAEQPLKPEPSSSFKPWVWRWEDLSEALTEAEEKVTLEGVEDRRVIRMVNPALGDGGPTSLTMQMSLQLVKPGEIARAHRHTIAAIRFVISGRGAYTTVEGERFEMAPGDLVLTPSWTWHDHGNYAHEPMIWLDGLDYPLLDRLETGFFQPFTEDRQSVVKTADHSLKRAGIVRPGWSPRAQATASPATHYRWEHVLSLLNDLTAEEESPYDGRVVEYVNPLTGGPTLRTLACSVQMLERGRTTRAHRHTSTSLYHVVEGEGKTQVGDDTLVWKAKDSFVVPPWLPHSHEASPDSPRALLFGMSDRPVYEALGLYRETGSESD
jgi:gentisate 1,2-dioxygenase